MSLKEELSEPLSEPLSGYVPLAERLKRTRLRQERPRSDGDIWASFLPRDTFSPYRNITDHSCLKVYHKDPAQAFSHGPRPANGDARVSTQLTHMQTQQCKLFSCEATRPVARRILRPASNSSHSHILFALQ